MTLLLREVGRFLIGATAWSCALASVAVVVTLGVIGLRRRTLPDARTVGWAVIGGGATAALAYRLGIDLWSPHVAGRPLPVAWIALGALATTIALVSRDGTGAPA